jgi:peptide/nickel transport system substrate-binding protein
MLVTPRRLLPTLLVSIVMMSAASSLGQGAEPTEAQRQTPITVAVGSIATDGLTTTSVLGGGIESHLIFMSPVEYDYRSGTYAIAPALARDIQVLDDGLRYRVTLRQDAKFHDGTAVDAEAVANWIAMLTDPDHSLYTCGHQRENHRLGTNAGVEIVDEYTLDFLLTRVNPAQFDWFTQNAYAPMSPAALTQYGCDIARNPVSTGPYMLADWQPGEYAVLDRFADFYDPAVGVTRRIIARYIPEMAAQVAALEAGEVHLIEGVSPEEAQRLRAIPGIEIVERETLFVFFFHFDTRVAPLDDVRVRQALNYAVNKDAIIDDTLMGAAHRSYAPLSPAFGEFYAGDVVHHYDYDPERARQLLTEAGHPDGFEITIHAIDTPRAGMERTLEVAQLVQADWRAIGVDARIEVSDWASFEPRRSRGEMAVAARGWTPWTGDPDGTILQNFHPRFHPPSGRAVTFLDDPEATRRMDLASITVDPVTRAQAWLDAQERIVELAPWLFLYHSVVFEAHTDRLQNYTPWSGGLFSGLLYAWLE